MIALERFNSLEKKIIDCEIKAMKIKAISFEKLQSFEYVFKNYDLNELYVIKDIGYTIITNKNKNQIDFIVIMKPNAIWKEHWQDVDKVLDIKQGVYLDLFTGKEYTDKFHVKAYEPSYFKAIGNEDLIIKGTINK